MPTDRREFLGRAASAAMLGAFPVALDLEARPAGSGAGAEWDVTWARRLTGKHKVVFDVPEIESGYGVWRASIVPRQYQGVLGVAVRDFTSVLILRHNAIALAMQQTFWDQYGIGKSKHVTHPLTLEPTDRNPALLTGADGLPERFDGLSLPQFLSRGNLALACDLALQDCIQLIATTDKVPPEVARKRAIDFLVPGVILQPSGVFAAALAQEGGCAYIRAS